MTTVAPYGSWRSPITSELVAGATIGLSEPRLDGSDIYWIEGRPAEGGRRVIVRKSEGADPIDVTPPPFNARTRVHEYGGGSYAVDDSLVVFSHFADGRLYRVDPGSSEPLPITPPDRRWRFADMQFDRRRDRIIAVREDHSADPDPEPRNELVAVPLDGSGGVRVLATGADFFSTPRLSPDGDRLAWLQWHHPNMPWDGTELWVGRLEDGGISSPERVAGGPAESIVQPEWDPEGPLVFVSDRSGWWNLYRLDGATATALAPSDSEFAGPAWVFGMAWYDIAADASILAVARSAGRDRLYRVEANRESVELETDFTELGSIRILGTRAVVVGGRPTAPTEIAVLDAKGGAVLETIRRAGEGRLDPTGLSEPESIEFPTRGGLTAHALFYPPRNAEFEGPPDERPPLVVEVHGGPTAHASSAMQLQIQFLTSRGIGVVEVDYGGSSGYGREYRSRLNDRFGIVDVEDSLAAARYLAARGDVDPVRLATSGGSSGGFTALAALAFHDLFAAGVSYFGITDLEGLAQGTHKFESRYIDGLVGPYPDAIDVYRERSPIHAAGRISSPLLVLQGLDDHVVPPAQAESLVEALRANGVPYAYLAFEGEGHGFRRADSIQRSLEAELSFYGQVFGFAPADEIEPLEVIGLATAARGAAGRST